MRFTLATAAATLLAIYFGAHVRYLSVALMVLCTGCLFCVSSPQQLLILENSRGGEMLGAALVQVAFNLGNALGAYCGGILAKSLALPPVVTILAGGLFAMVVSVITGLPFCLLYTSISSRNIRAQAI